MLPESELCRGKLVRFQQEDLVIVLSSLDGLGKILQTKGPDREITLARVTQQDSERLTNPEFIADLKSVLEELIQKIAQKLG